MTPRFIEKRRADSVGVANIVERLGKQDNCQVAVTLSIANHSASLPIAITGSICRRHGQMMRHGGKRHMWPKDIRFKTKPQIALDQIRAAHAEGVAPAYRLGRCGLWCKQ